MLIANFDYMRKLYYLFALLLAFSLSCCNASAQNKNLKLVFIRHAERPDDGDNLNCQGINRSYLLPAVLFGKFGIPQNVYVPTLSVGKRTKHARMLETISPFVAKYNVTVNSQFDEADNIRMAQSLLKEHGTILIVWEHNNIEPIVSALGVNAGLTDWPDSDFDSIWIVTFKKGVPTLTKDKEGLHPSEVCAF